MAKIIVATDDPQVFAALKTIIESTNVQLKKMKKPTAVITIED